MGKYIKIYIWQLVSIVLNFGSVFIVTPYISSNKALYGIYTIVVSAYLFISYADFGFLSAGMKYASECYAQKDEKEEINILGFSGVIFLTFVSIYAVGVLVVAYDPTVLIKNLSIGPEISIARKMFIILAFSCPLLVFQRIIQIIYGIRLQDYKFQRILIISSLVKIVSTFFFFSNGKYMIVEYFLFSQLCLLFAVVAGGLMLNRSINYNIKLLVSSFRFSKRIYNKTKKLAFTSIFLTVSWILYYELDPFAIGKLLGTTQVAVYAIGLTVISYFRSIFGILFTPFIARFNHFIGLNDKEGLRAFFLKVTVLFFPVTVFPVLVVLVTVKSFILTWVGVSYIQSTVIVQVLVACYLFSFITYPSGILIIANESVKSLYLTSSLQPVIFWAGVIITYPILGLKSFAYFKLLAFFLETVVYIVIVSRFLNVSIHKYITMIIKPALLPLCVIFLLLFTFKNYEPVQKGKVFLAYYFFYVITITGIGIICYYFTSLTFKIFVDKLLNNIFKKRVSTT